jgi:hypothetical protein
MASREDISIRFGDSDQTIRTAPVSVGEDHILDIELNEASKISAITIVDSYEVLKSAPAMGTAGAYHLVHDANKDILCIELRREVASRVPSLRLEPIAIDGNPVLDLLFDTEGELEGILIQEYSERTAGELPTEQRRRRWWARGSTKS